MDKTAEVLDDIGRMITDGLSLQAPNIVPLLIQNPFRAGKAKPIIDSVHKFDDVLSAYDTILTGHTRGKVVVEIS